MTTTGLSCKSVDVVVRQRGGAWCARAGSGWAAQLASSTNCALVAAEAAAKKFFAGAEVTLEMKARGDCTAPTVYLARRALP